MTAEAGGAGGRVPGYLGRVLDGGIPTGTCFQVAPGVLVTAWHVLDGIDAADEGARVEVDPLAGGEPFGVAVVRADPLRDLVVLASDVSLSGAAGPLAVTDQLPLRALVHVTGHAVPDDPGRSYRFLDAPGEWAGACPPGVRISTPCNWTRRGYPGSSVSGRQGSGRYAPGSRPSAGSRVAQARWNRSMRPEYVGAVLANLMNTAPVPEEIHRSRFPALSAQS